MTFGLRREVIPRSIPDDQRKGNSSDRVRSFKNVGRADPSSLRDQSMTDQSERGIKHVVDSRQTQSKCMTRGHLRAIRLEGLKGRNSFTI